MAHMLALLLAHIFTFGHIVLTEATRQASVKTKASTPLESTSTLRQEACHFCYHQCPISCFVGACGGAENDTSVHRFENTDSCWSCDPSSAIGINQFSDLKICSGDESGARNSFINQTTAADSNPSGVVNGALAGPGMPGDPWKKFKTAYVSAKSALDSVQNAASASGLAAGMATATASYGQGNVMGANAADDAAAKSMTAMQMKSDTSFRAYQEAHAAWKSAVTDYNNVIQQIRTVQIQAEQFEGQVVNAEAAADRAHAAYGIASGDARQAQLQAMLAGQRENEAEVARDQAEEMAADARTSQRRLMYAAKEVKTASDRIQPFVEGVAEIQMPAVAPPPMMATAVAAMDETRRSVLRHGRAL